MRRSERVTGCQSHQSEFWNSIASSAFIFTVALLISTVESGPINRQVGISENVYITVQNDTYGIEQRVCSIDSMTYSDGESIPTSSPCEHCICRPPGFACTIISCEYRAGCKAVQRADHCCPEFRCECEKDGKIYQNGEKILDNNNPCEVCYCQGGDIICAVIDCYWRSDCQPRYIENRCCPVYDHCAPGHPGPHRPTQRPLLTTSATLGTTVGWFNLSSSIFASSSTPLAQLEDVSSSTTLTPAAALVPEPISTSSASPPQENEIVGSVPEVEQSQENSILPEQNIVSSSSSPVPVPVSTETPEQQQQQEESSASPIHVLPPVEQTSENVQNNVVEPVEEEAVKDSLVSSSSTESNILPSSESSVQLESSSSPIINSENVPEVSVASSSTTTTTTTLPQEDVQIQTSPVSTNVEENEPVVEAAVATESAVPSNNLVVDEQNEQNEPLQSSSSSSPAQVEPSVSSVVVVSSPVDETITVQETSSQIPDSSIITEILPVLDSESNVQSSSSSVVIILDSTPVSQLESVTVANLERDSTVLSSSSLVQQTEALESVTVVNSLDIPSPSVVVEPTESLSVVISSSSISNIDPSLSSDSPSSSSVLGSINIDESIDDSVTTEATFIDVSTPDLQSSSSAPSISVDDEVETVKDVAVPAETPSSVVVSENEIDITTQVVPSLDDKVSSIKVPSTELQPPNVENEIVVDDPKPSVENQQQNLPAQPSLELQPPIHEAIVPVQVNPIDDEPIQTTAASSSVSDDVVTIQPELQVPSSSPVVNQNIDDSSSSAAAVVDPDLNDDNSVGISTVSSLNDPIVTEIPTESPKLVENDSQASQGSHGYLPVADSPSSSSSSIPVVSSTSETPVAPETESSSVLQDQTEGTLNDEAIIQTTQNPQVVVDQESSSSSSSSPSSVVVLPDSVNDEVTDSLPVFDETVDTIKANQQPTVSSVADEVTEIEALKSSTVPPTESPVNISFVDLNDGASESPVTVVNGDQQQQLDLDSQDQADPVSVDEDSPVVFTTTIPSVSESSSPAKVSDKVEEVVLADEVTTVSSSSSSSSSNDISQQSVQNDEPITIVQTTVNSIIQADEPEKATQVPQSSIVSDGVDDTNPNTNTASPVNTVVSDDDVQSDDVATTLSTVSQLNDESASPSDETTIRVVPASSSVISSQSDAESDVSEVQNDEAVVATTSVPSLNILNDANDEGGDSTTVRQTLEDIPSSDSLFRLDPSVFTDSSKENTINNNNNKPVASLLKSTSSSLISDQNNENDVIFDNVVAPTTQTPEQIKANQLLLNDDVERIETTEVNQRVNDAPEQIELTTTRSSSLGEDRKDFQDETTSKVVELTQDDDITTVTTTETTGNLLRHHHPDHDSFRVESTTLEASTITINNDENDVEGSGQSQSDSTDNSIQNDDETTIYPNLNNSQNVEAKVNSTFARKGAVIIPNELVKRPDPITDDLQLNGLGRSDGVGQMKSENPDETWFWRAVNRVRTLPDFLPTFSLSRQPRSTDSVDGSSHKANAQLYTSSKNNINSNDYDNNNHKKAPHRPFLFW